MVNVDIINSIFLKLAQRVFFVKSLENFRAGFLARSWLDKSEAFAFKPFIRNGTSPATLEIFLECSGNQKLIFNKHFQRS